MQPEVPQQIDGPAPPQHMQRKISRKVNFLEKVAASKKAVQQHKAGVKKKRKVKPLPDLKALAGSLDELLAQQQVQKPKQQQQQQKGLACSVKRLKARALIAAKETARLHQVLEHPEFKANPIQAITNHLASTLPPPPAAPQQNRQQSKHKKKKQRPNV
eukprot:jgi/Chrzof1/4954/Cz15g06060.t1